MMLTHSEVLLRDIEDLMSFDWLLARLREQEWKSFDVQKMSL